MSTVISELLALSQDEGNAVRDEEIGWGKARVVYRMAQPMSERLRSVGHQRTELRYYTCNDSHYGPPEEGFFDEAAEIGIAFPEKSPPEC
jgi:hypothetical protein